MDTVEQVLTPENKQRLATFFGVIRDMVRGPQQFTIVDDETSNLTITQQNGVPTVVMTKGFLASLGSHRLVVGGNFTADRVYPSEQMATGASNPSDDDFGRLIKAGYILFTPNSDGSYQLRYNNSVLEAVGDINMINYIKKNNLDAGIFQMVTEFLADKHVKFHIVGQPWPAGDQNVALGGEGPVRIVEKVVEVVRHIKTEVPFYVDRIVTKEVYKCEHTAQGQAHTKENQVKTQSKTKTIPDPDDDVDDKVKESESSKTSTASSSSSSTEEQTNDGTESSEETSSSSSEEEKAPTPKKKSPPKPAVSKPTVTKPPVSKSTASESTKETKETKNDKNTLKIKGQYLNKQKTIVQSGDFVYRVIKKVDGPSQLEAICRWDKKTETQVPFRKGDEARIKELGYKIAKKDE